MSMQEVREQNIALVTQTALACFVENGIEKTTIRDIAQHAGLTERSGAVMTRTRARMSSSSRRPTSTGTGPRSWPRSRWQSSGAGA